MTSTLARRARNLWASRWGTLLRGLLVVAIAVYLLHSVDIGSALRRARSADPGTVVLAVVVLTAVHAVAALTWSAIAGRFGTPMGTLDAVGDYYASQALGGITPANLGGDAYRVVVRPHASRGEAAIGVLVQRATSFLALAALGGAALLALPNVSSISWPLIATTLALALVLVVPAAVLLQRRPRRVAGKRAELVSAAAIGFAGGIAFHAIAIGASYALVLAIDARAGGLSILGAITLARLSLAVPISPSGLGVQEGALAALFIALGASPETAVAASLLGRLALLTTTGIGLVIVARGRGRTPPDIAHAAVSMSGAEPEVVVRGAG